MALQNITDISIDFYDKKYILINAKQLDKNSRYLSVACYNHGNAMSINSGEHSAYIRYRKSDENGVFNECQIDRKGKILVELTEQMLASDGVCCADFILVNKGDANIDVDTGEVLYIDNASILSSMVFYIDVSEVAVNNFNIESSYEYDGLNSALQKAEAEYKEVIQLARSYAIGNADGIRENEDYDNAKYYYEQSLINADNAEDSKDAAYVSEQNAKDHMDKTEEYMNSASQSEANAKTYMDNADGYMDKAEEYMNSASTSAFNANTSETNASNSATNASQSATDASNSASSASTSATNASQSETNALNSANKAQSYTVGGTGTRVGEDTDNSKYYYEKIVTIADGIIGGFIPIGTITFAELATAEKVTGYVYNISDDFVTDSSFRDGEGKSYTAGTNVYYTANDEWDCLGGASSPTATVDEVKEYLGI